MTWPLLAGIAGLAALDSLNPATLVMVTLILLGSRGHPVTEAFGVVVGAFATVLAVGTGLYLGAETAADAVGDGLVWLRRIAFGAAALVLLISSVRALRPRQRSELALPAWFGPRTAVALGVVMTGADLPNAFPYFIAIERLVDAGVDMDQAALVLVGYAIVYCVPCLALLGLGLAHGERVQRALRRIHARFGTSTVVPVSRRRAALLLVGAIALAAVAANT